jgi:hypothetical protein
MSIRRGQGAHGRWRRGQSAHLLMHRFQLKKFWEPIPVKDQLTAEVQAKVR